MLNVLQLLINCEEFALSLHVFIESIFHICLFCDFYRKNQKKFVSLTVGQINYDISFILKLNPLKLIISADYNTFTKISV
jgi:hypothetical protein